MYKGQAEAETPDAEFTRSVRAALANLYDPAYLQNHSLISVLDLGANADRVTRAQGVRRLLLECIEALRPEGGGHDQADAARAYAILTYRYVDGLSMEGVARKLALSRRQAYREHRKGIQAVASLLWDRVQEAGSRKQGVGSRTQEEGDRSSAANRLSADRFSVARAEAGRLQRAAQVESLGLQDVLEKVLEMLNPVARQMDIKITTLSPSVWPPVVADRVMLRQAFLNLLSYAIHIVQGDLVVSASREKDDLLVEICESPGDVSLSSLSATERDEVGLAVAQALIEAQGGHLETQDCEGRWAVCIHLPTSGKAIVLVIDDNEDIVALFQRYLAGHKVSVVGVTDGEQALQLAAQLQPQVITLDVMMPSLDGWEVLQRLRSTPETKHIPVVVCSVLNEPRLALSMGASETITKPVKQIDLLDVLQRHLGPLRPAG